MSAVKGKDQKRIRLTIHGKEYEFPPESRYRDVTAKAAEQDPDSGAAQALLILENNKLREVCKLSETERGLVMVSGDAYHYSKNSLFKN